MQELDLARRHALDLARPWWSAEFLFEGKLGYGIVPADEFDGAPVTILLEYNPFDQKQRYVRGRAPPFLREPRQNP